MRFQLLVLAFALAEAKTCPSARNFIYVVPDGYGIASQTLARDYYSIINGEGTAARPNSAQIGVDSMVPYLRMTTNSSQFTYAVNRSLALSVLRPRIHSSPTRLPPQLPLAAVSRHTMAVCNDRSFLKPQLNL